MNDKERKIDALFSSIGEIDDALIEEAWLTRNTLVAEP